MKTKKNISRSAVLLCIGGVAALFLGIFMLCVGTAQTAYAEERAATLTLTGGTARYYELYKNDYRMPYKNLSLDDYNMFKRRVSVTFSGNGVILGADQDIIYTDCNSFSIKYSFDASYNESIGKSWVSTREHTLTLKRDNGNAVTPVQATGGSSNDSSCSIENRYSALTDGKYTFETFFWQGHGIHSTQFADAFFYTQTIVVDTKSPTIGCSAEATNTSVSATFSAKETESPVSATYTHNDTYKGAYSSGTALTDEGKYVITVTDKVGNSSRKTLYVDKTAPVLSGDTVSKTSISATWAVGAYDSAVTATYSLNGNEMGEYVCGTTLSHEGRYIITATDRAGNRTSKTFFVDRTAPVISASVEISNRLVTATIAAPGNNESPLSISYTLNDVAMGTYSSGKVLSAEGKYVITATDAAGNSASKTLYVDKTAPLLSFAEVSTTSVRSSWSVGAYETSITATYVHTSASGVSSAKPYSSGQALTAEGKYEITATDAAGNRSNKTLYVDRTAPAFDVAPPSRTSVRAVFSATPYESPVTATYKLNDGAPVAYITGKALTDEGRYIFTVTDRAGNSTSRTTYVDKTAPFFVRSFEYGNTDGTVTFARTDYESAVTAKYSYIGEHGKKTDVAYKSGQTLTDEGEYTVTATDAAGNSATTKITVDRKAPLLYFADGSTGTSCITRTGSSVMWNTESYESPIAAIYSFTSENEEQAPSISEAPYMSDSTFTAEGTYVFNVRDLAGNVVRATVIIDKTAPEAIFLAGGVRFARFTASSFTASGEDALSGVAKIELYENGRYVDYDYTPRSSNGEYLFRVTDRAGNFSSATATVYKTDTFGNLERLKTGYKVNSWYVVTLPARIFTTPGNDVAGRYSFESYDKALEFAISNERAFRVRAVQGGYMYVSATNESIAQKYDDETTLLSVVEKYARGYVSSRQVSGADGNDRYFTEPSSLTRNSPILPDYLLDLKDLPRFFARSGVTWNLPSISYIAAMSYSVTAAYLGDTSAESGSEHDIPRGSTLKNALGGEYRQGWYLITESDEAGNTERYLIYSDAELPTVRVSAARGDGSTGFILDYTYVNNETLYFLTFGFESLLDNVDPFITLKIEKGNTANYYTQADEMPVLGMGDFTGGKYTVTVYDRSLNVLTFNVYIAGNAPTMTHSSLAADKPDCKISFLTSDRYNFITEIKLYKIEYDGSETVLTADGTGAPISAATLTYTLTCGGKYGATLTDNYRRTVEISPIFFLKGLPSGRLSGVADGGRTNSNVSFTFDAVDMCEFYTLHQNGERRLFTDYTVQTGSTNKTYSITASETTSYEYLVFLHNAEDLSLFVEYTFEIDTVLPTFEITDSAGNVIPPDGATNKPFGIKWQETGVKVRYYTAKGGQITATKYNMNSVLSQGTLYYFTIKDDVGNSLDFTVLLDNAVDYAIDGNYTEIDGVIYANAPIVFTVNEPTQTFSVKSSDGDTIENGGTLKREGSYDITVTDNYRNTVTLCVILDFTPPTLELAGAKNGGVVKNDVVVSAFDYDFLYLADSRGNKLKDIENSELFTVAGTYYIVARDRAGNSVTVSFSIDLSVDYKLSVPIGAVTTEKVALNSDEPLDITVKLNGEPAESATRFTECGEYELTLTDPIGNSVTCAFTIIPRRVQTLSQALPNGTTIAQILHNGEPIDFSSKDTLSFDMTGVYTVTLDCGGTQFELTVETDNTPPVVTLTESDGNTIISAVDKENVKLALTKDGEAMDCRVGQTLDQPGHYILTATDELGNQSELEFDIPFRLNTWAIVAIAIGGVAVIVVVVLIIRAGRKPRLK